MMKGRYHLKYDCLSGLLKAKVLVRERARKSKKCEKKNCKRMGVMRTKGSFSYGVGFPPKLVTTPNHQSAGQMDV